MVSASTLQVLRSEVGAVRDPHLPFGIAELGMLEQVSIAASGHVQVVVNLPCHHCPGLQMMEQDIQAAVRRVGVQADVMVSFQGRSPWSPADLAPHARVAMQAMGIQSIVRPPVRWGVSA